MRGDKVVTIYDLEILNRCFSSCPTRRPRISGGSAGAPVTEKSEAVEEIQGMGGNSSCTVRKSGVRDRKTVTE